MINSIVLILSIAAMNFVRGRGIIPKPFTSLLSGLATGLAAYLAGQTLQISAMIAACVFLGIYLWCLFGWGKYFSAFHGRDDVNEKEIGFIDWIGYKVYPPESGRNMARGVLCMAIRGCFIAPMFIGLAFILQSPYPLLGIIIGPLQGLYYGAMRFVPEKHAVMISEILYGLMLGAGIAFVL